MKVKDRVKVNEKRVIVTWNFGQTEQNGRLPFRPEKRGRRKGRIYPYSSASVKVRQNHRNPSY